VIVDQQAMTTTHDMAVPGDMDLGHCRGWKRLEIGFGIEAEIAATDENVVNITEQAAARAAHQLPRKSGSGIVECR
jgi:hypothetical protein